MPGLADPFADPFADPAARSVTCPGRQIGRGRRIDQGGLPGKPRDRGTGGVGRGMIRGGVAAGGGLPRIWYWIRVWSVVGQDAAANFGRSTILCREPLQSGTAEDQMAAV